MRQGTSAGSTLNAFGLDAGGSSDVPYTPPHVCLDHGSSSARGVRRLPVRGRVTDIVAHRGGAGLRTENSLDAFRGTLTLGVDQVEFDVQLSADGVPVVFHDETLERVSDGTGLLGTKTLAELERLSLVGGGGRIPTLDAVIGILGAGSAVLRCEIKPGPGLLPYPELIEKSVSRIEAAGLLPRTIFTGFHLPTVTAIAERATGCRGVAWLVAKSVIRLVGTESTCALANAHGVSSMSMHHTLLDRDMLATVRAHGLTIGTFGVLDEETIDRVLGKGVDLLTTDRPDVALSRRAAFAAEPR